jgi:hypothetical protein
MFAKAARKLGKLSSDEFREGLTAWRQSVERDEGRVTTNLPEFPRDSEKAFGLRFHASEEFSGELGTVEHHASSASSGPTGSNSASTGSASGWPYRAAMYWSKVGVTSR